MENISTLRDGTVTTPPLVYHFGHWDNCKIDGAKRVKLLVVHDGHQEFGYEIDDLRRAGLAADCEVEILTVVDLFLAPLYWANGDTPDLSYYYDDRISSRYSLRNVAELFYKMETESRLARKKLKAAFPYWNVRSTVSAELPSRAVIDKAIRWQPDLVVIGSNNLTWMERRGLRRLTRRLISQAHCSVRVVRPPRGSTETPSRIMITFDGSNSATAALETVRQRTWTAGSEAYVLSCVEPLIADELNWADDFVELDRRRAERELALAKTLLEESGLKVSTIIPVGDPVQTLVDEAQRLNVESIFLGTRELGLVETLLCRSVSSTVACRANCSVEIVRSSQEPQLRVGEQCLAA